MDERAASPLIGGLLMVAVAIVIAGVALLAWYDQPGVEQEPRMVVSESSDRLVIVSVQNGPLDWSDIDVDGCSSVPSGVVGPGDTLSGCAGRVTFVYENRLLLDRQVTPS